MITRKVELSLALVLSAATMGFGCSSDGSDSNDGSSSGTGGGPGSGGGSSSGGSSSSGATLHGSFVITMNAANAETGNEAFTSIQGNLRDGEPNEAIAWEFVRSDGDCELFVPVFPFCDPACASGETCVVGDTCRADPAPLSAGAVTFEGLDTAEGGVSFSISPIGGKQNYLLPASVEVAYPPAAEGSPIALTSEGGEFGPLHIESAGISPLEVLADEVPIGLDQEIPLEWTPPGADAKSRMGINLEISHHGGRKGQIVCDTADTGSYTISAPLVTELIQLGYAGFPTIKFSRKVTGTSDAPHQVELTVVQHVALPIVIDGLISCSTDDDCSDGETCQPDRSCG